MTGLVLENGVLCVGHKKELSWFFAEFSMKSNYKNDNKEKNNEKNDRCHLRQNEVSPVASKR